MKTYKVKVNGKVYEVELEAVTESNGTISAPATAPAPAAAATPAPAPATAGAKTIVAPIAGKVLSIAVKVGDTVKKGQSVAVIEAMKLENEIPSAFDGKVVSVNVTVGAMVNSQDTLIVLG